MDMWNGAVPRFNRYNQSQQDKTKPSLQGISAMLAYQNSWHSRGVGAPLVVDTVEFGHHDEAAPWDEAKAKQHLDDALEGEETVKNQLLTCLQRLVVGGKERRPRSIILSGFPEEGGLNLARAIGATLNIADEHIQVVSPELLAEQYGKSRRHWIKGISETLKTANKNPIDWYLLVFNGIDLTNTSSTGEVLVQAVLNPTVASLPRHYGVEESADEAFPIPRNLLMVAVATHIPGQAQGKDTLDLISESSQP